MRLSDDIKHNVPFGDLIDGHQPMAADYLPMAVLEAANPSLAASVKAGNDVTPDVVMGGQFEAAPGVQAEFLNSTLGAVADPENPGMVFRTGLTVPKRCPQGTGSNRAEIDALPLAKRRALNCASAHAEWAMADAKPEMRYMFVPVFGGQTAREDVIMLHKVHGTRIPSPVEAEGRVAFYRLGNAHAVVVRQSWLESLGDKLVLGINAADATLGLASITVPAGDHGEEETFHVAFSTERRSLGLRKDDPLARPLATAVEMILDELVAHSRVLDGVKMYVQLGSSATTEYFKHDIEIPSYMYGDKINPFAKQLAESMGISVSEFARRHAISQQVREGEDVEAARDDLVVESDVMEWQYPGALPGGFVYGWDDVLGQLVQRDEQGCPGFGELCHLDYRGLTEFTLRHQLEQLGVELVFSDERAVDPSDPETNFASNRADQLAGIAGSHSSRTFCGVSLVPVS